jgi:hypothetical protein
MPFIFNRIKPGYCPENDVRLGRNELDGAVCSVQCMHDYDCKGNRLCVSFNLFQMFIFNWNLIQMNNLKCPSDCNGKICVKPVRRSQNNGFKMPGTCPKFSDPQLPCSMDSGLNLKQCRIGWPESSKNGCPSNQKCCVYPCGGVCIELWIKLA